MPVQLRRNYSGYIQIGLQSTDSTFGSGWLQRNAEAGIVPNNISQNPNFTHKHAPKPHDKYVRPCPTP